MKIAEQHRHQSTIVNAQKWQMKHVAYSASFHFELVTLKKLITNLWAKDWSPLAIPTLM